MLNKFYPDMEAESVYHIDFTKLKKQGYKGVLFDIDNTLVPHGAPADERIVAFFKQLRELGFAHCLISNNKLPRVKPFAEAVKSPYVEDAHKPLLRSYQKAIELMGCRKTEALFVGDQLFTDVYGARRAGMKAILVRPIHPKEEIQIVLKRYLERVVLHFYRKQGKDK